MAGRNPKLNRLVPVLLCWFAANARDLPWRSRNARRDPYAIWVSEIMLQQTQAKTVIPYWKRWMRELPNIEAVANASSDKTHKLWEGLGYYARARNLQKAARQIVEKHGGRFPENFTDVLALPGIGCYTAGAICSIAFNQPTPILDGNVIRVLTRIFGIGENPREKETNAKLWKLAEELVGRAVPSPPRRGGDTAPYHSFLNQSLMELGALVCTPRQPKCPDCPAKEFCVAFRENRVAALPNLGKHAPASARHFIAFIVKQDGRFLVRQRPARVVNAHLWEFPNVEVAAGIVPALEPGFQPRGKIPSNPKPVRTPREIPGGRMPPSPAGRRPAATTTSLARAAKNLGFALLDVKPLCTVKHSITRYRITLEAFHVKLGGTSYTSPHSRPAKSWTRIARSSETAVWQTPAQMRQLAFTAAHRKILQALTASGPSRRRVRSSILPLRTTA